VVKVDNGRETLRTASKGASTLWAGTGPVAADLLLTRLDCSWEFWLQPPACAQAILSRGRRDQTVNGMAHQASDRVGAKVAYRAGDLICLRWIPARLGFRGKCTRNGMISARKPATHWIKRFRPAPHPQCQLRRSGAEPCGALSV
jgi:hypothetical protein